MQWKQTGAGVQAQSRVERTVQFSVTILILKDNFGIAEGSGLLRLTEARSGARSVTRSTIHPEIYVENHSRP
jgi:hypothetical protein